MTRPSVCGPRRASAPVCVSRSSGSIVPARPEPNTGWIDTPPTYGVSSATRITSPISSSLTPRAAVIVRVVKTSASRQPPHGARLDRRAGRRRGGAARSRRAARRTAGRPRPARGAGGTARAASSSRASAMPLVLTRMRTTLRATSPSSSSGSCGCRVGSPPLIITTSRRPFSRAIRWSTLARTSATGTTPRSSGEDVGEARRAAQVAALDDVLEQDARVLGLHLAQPAQVGRRHRVEVARRCRARATSSARSTARGR